MLRSTCQSCQIVLTGEGIPALQRAVLAHRCGVAKPKRKLTRLQQALAQPIRPPTARSWTFDRDVLSGNKAVYGHWTVHAKDKKDWQARLQPIIGQMGGCHLYSTWRLTRYYGGKSRLMDAINYAAGFKPLVDLLTEGQVIVDDSPTYFRRDYAPQQRCEGASHCVLELLNHGTTPNILS